MGLPKNTLTQEGLAILSEYLSSNLDIKRLKELALRVLCIKYLVKGMDFKGAFNRLVNKFDFPCPLFAQMRHLNGNDINLSTLTVYESVGSITFNTL